MDYQIVLSASARADIRDIVRYISLDAPERALSFGQFLISKTKLLRQFPEMGRVRLLVPLYERSLFDLIG